MKAIKFLYYLSAIAVIAGAASRMLLPDMYAYIYSAAAVVFAVTQFILRPRHSHVAVRRLIMQQQIGALFLVGAGVLMFTHSNNEWMAAMLCGALIELYTAYRIPVEIEKHK
ncbi:MAG: hypothetical protein J6U62_03945 [Bacteroidaceae bacterium]|nr:hypothetical protein [Bacteroidaceae bacterium]